jgi:hypothetical protein
MKRKTSAKFEAADTLTTNSTHTLKRQNFADAPKLPNDVPLESRLNDLLKKLVVYIFCS